MRQRQLGYFFARVSCFGGLSLVFQPEIKNEIKMELLLDQDTCSMDICQNIRQLGHAAWTGRFAIARCENGEPNSGFALCF